LSVALAWGLAACAADESSRGDASTHVDNSACPAFEACGGDIVGTWTIQNLCSDDLVQIVRSSIFQPECLDGVLSVTADASGSEVFDSAGTNESSRTLSLEAHSLWTLECLQAMNDGQPVELGDACAESARVSALAPQTLYATCDVVGDACDCMSGLEIELGGSRSYQVSGPQLAIEGLKHEYCVSGDTLRVLEHGLNTEMVFTLMRVK